MSTPRLVPLSYLLSSLIPHVAHGQWAESCSENGIQAERRYQEQVGGTYTEGEGRPAKRGERLALELGYADDEIRFGFPGIELPLGAVQLVSPGISFTTLVHDPYNGEKPATSVSGLGTIGLMMFASFFHSDDVGRNAASVLGTIILGPAMLANSELHFAMGSTDSVSGPGTMNLSLYVATRTEVFVPWKSGANSWVRFSPAVGFSLERQVSPPGPSLVAQSIGLQWGVDCPVDVVPHAGQNGLRVFVGVRYLLPL